MRWFSSLSTAMKVDDAVEEVVTAALAAVPNPDLALVFVHPKYVGGFARLARTLRERLGGPALVGCSGEGIIGGGREVERQAALALTVAALPQVEVHPFYLRPGEVPPSPEAWLARVGAPPEAGPAFVLLADPFSTDTEALLRSLDETWPRSPKVGGLASGGRAAGQNVVFVGDAVHTGGTAGVALVGDVEVRPIVAQGARPFGEEMTVTRSEGPRLLALDGELALARLDRAYAALSAADQALFRRAPMIGLAPADLGRPARAGDWLVRNLLGVDRAAGVIGVGGVLQPGMRVRFHVRDPRSAAEELDELLARAAREGPPAGALLFSCLGRGEGFFGAPDHDSDALRRRLGEVPVGGFFCNGEIGPIHARTFLHGYTSAFGLFRPRQWD